MRQHGLSKLRAGNASSCRALCLRSSRPCTLAVHNILWSSRQGPSKAQAASTSNAVAVRPPAKQPQLAKQEEAPTTPATPSSSITDVVAEYAAQLVSSISLPWPSGASPEAGAGQATAPAPTAEESSHVSIDHCLQSIPIWELKHIRKLCHLTSLTYKMHRVTPRGMRRRHQLTLVTTSWACEIRLYEHTKSAHEVADEGDGMAVSVHDAKSTYHSLVGRNTPQQPPTAASSSSVPLSNIVPLPPSVEHDSGTHASLGPTTPPAQLQAGANGNGQPQPQPQQQQGANSSGPRWASPAQMVAGMVVEAATAAASAASPLASAAVTPIASAASSLYAGLASLPIASALGANPLSSAPSAAAAIMSAAAAAVRAGVTAATPGSTQMAVGLAAAAGPAAIAAAPAGTSMRLAAPVQSTTGSPACPSEWFVCDDPATCTRYFVIQGSDSVDHWKLNLSFDPVSFENPALGIKVHRGAYEAAQILYERFLPMVYEHLDASPFAKICFTGHSIGGSLSTLLALMYYHRGVLPAANLATVYTFGSPAIFCMDPTPTACPQHPQPAPSSSTTAPASSPPLGPVASLTSAPFGAATSAGLVAAQPAENEPELAAVEERLVPHQAKHYEPQHKPRHHLAHLRSKQQHSGAPLVDPNNDSPIRVLPCRCGTGEGCTPLSALGLPEHIVRNIIMPRDIVPKAFACDYALVSDILQSWGPGFKAHAGLVNPRRHLYYVTGRMMVLQPDSSWHWFAQPEPYHAMLPPTADMWLVGPPRRTAKGSAAAEGARSPAARAAAPTPGVLSPMPVNGTPAIGAAPQDPPAGATMAAVAAFAATGVVGAAAVPDAAPVTSSSDISNSNGVGMQLVASPANGSSNFTSSSSSSSAVVQVTKQRVQTEAEALWALMDTPHPLEVLGDPGAYLDRGSISRYHNPDNYTAALGRLIYIKRKQEGRIPSWQYHAYSRSLMMEAAEAQREWEGYGVRGEVLLAGHDDMAPWDSSDGDAMLAPPVPAMLPY